MDRSHRGGRAGHDRLWVYLLGRPLRSIQPQDPFRARHAVPCHPRHPDGVHHGSAPAPPHPGRPGVPGWDLDHRVDHRGGHLHRKRAAPPHGGLPVCPHPRPNLRAAARSHGRRRLQFPRRLLGLRPDALRRLDLRASRAQPHPAAATAVRRREIPRRQIWLAWLVSLVGTMHIVFLPSILPTILRGFEIPEPGNW